MKRWLLRILLGGSGLFGVAFGSVWYTATPDMGAKAAGERLQRMEASPQWGEGAFENRLAQVDGEISETMGKEFGGGSEHQEPDGPLPVVQRSGADFAAHPESGLRVTWLGHSTLILELDGARILVDPVWGDRTSPWASTGPMRFHAPPLPLDELPQVDAVIISHDHYDHLDYSTVSQMLEVDTTWVVPLGIGAHLEHWGIASERIVELDWWEETRVAGLTLTSTPARHFSGRWLDRMSTTLWTGWALRGPEHAIWYSGDTALMPEFSEVGERLGPFDMTLIEVGAYDSTWTDVHLGPEQAVIAHQMVGGSGVLLPVHWGLFDLGNHGWTEPLERTLLAGQRQEVKVVAPRPGASVELADGEDFERWWPEVPFETVESDPVWSTSVDELITRWWGPR